MNFQKIAMELNSFISKYINDGREYVKNDLAVSPYSQRDHILFINPGIGLQLLISTLSINMDIAY